MFGSATPAAKTATDLKNLTGLKEERAKECFGVGGNYPAALASFVQSYSEIPDAYFDDRSITTKNAKQINEELLVIYKKARELKTKSGKSDNEVWKMYEQAPATPSPFSSAIGNAQTETNSASPFSSVPVAFGAAKPAGTNSASPFSSVPAAFGAAKPAGTNSASPFSSVPAAFGAAKPASAFASAFNTANPAIVSAAPASTVSFGFGTAPVTTGPVAVADFGVKAVAVRDEPPKKSVKYHEPTHFTGPYFSMPDFWEKEVVERAPLLNLNKGFLETHRDDLRTRLEKWMGPVSFSRGPVKYVDIEDEDEEVVRVIIKDADRTFFSPVHRRKLVEFLNAMYNEFGTYGQAMSYLAGICMLVLTEEETAAVIRHVAKNHIKRHWEAEAVGFATSAWVVEYFMQQHFPDVAAHLDSFNFWPDTYLQKILTGLCIHVLDFADLFDFLDSFMKGGFPYLVRFCLAVVERFRTDLLKIQSSNEANTVYEIMRLDHRTADHEDIRAILARANTIDLGDDEARMDIIRSEVYEKKVEPRLKRAPKTDTFEPCQRCNEKRPSWYCDELGAVCDDCRNDTPNFTYEKY